MVGIVSFICLNFYRLFKILLNCFILCFFFLNSYSVFLMENEIVFIFGLGILCIFCFRFLLNIGIFLFLFKLLI